ncbi:hypothetical protein [Rhodopirellula europaea]|uniref:Uncharacterized protein n=1 Tax=Rhodopirellula europaea 6C TaxID=1263867 RepID=M2AQC6_9BACT|nr:hypothetical protein [Rhodopirellula europaea]EMB14922.1 hypothetical protein RE6C_04380 [Rhodopirellula europaea 6C]
MRRTTIAAAAEILNELAAEMEAKAAASSEQMPTATPRYRRPNSTKTQLPSTSSDNLAGTDVGNQSNESVTGKFESYGLNISGGVQKLDPIGLDVPAEKRTQEPREEGPEVIVAPKLLIDDQLEDSIAQQDPEPEAIADTDLQNINARLIAVG